MSAPMPGDHGGWDALAVGWALSALDPTDEERFAAHLPGCELCTATVRESLHTVADLAYALPDEVPPPSLKNRLMAAVAAEPRPGTDRPAPSAGSSASFADPPVSSDGTVRFEGVAPGGGVTTPTPERRGGRHAAPTDDDRTVVPFEPRRRTGWARRVTVGAAAAAVLALLGTLGAWNLQLRGEQDDLRQAVAARDAVAAQREATIRELTANEPATVAALTADGKPSPDRSATIVIRGDQVEIILEGLGATEGDIRYWLWTLSCEGGTPSNLRPIEGFQVTQPSFSVRDIGSDPGVASSPCFAISQERGTATPTAPARVVAIGQPQEQ
jgi:hypothetical protein